ncbi:MAG: hydrolase [Nitrospiraceae bacterium]|nr:hydrolase [Nitrospiraceae bacterium]
MYLKSGERFLLIGDSITDAGRREDPEELGFGYVRQLRDMLWTLCPTLDVDLVNRGIGGDTIRDLDARWEEDVIALKPDVLSISIGVNDVWRQLQEPTNPEEVPLDEFVATYRRLLTHTRERAECRLILCEATIIGETRDAPHNPVVDAYNSVVAGLADEFDALLAPMCAAFWRVIEANPARSWTSDGVHPLSNGHMVMAQTLYATLDGAV